jgi:hypothetical protein
VSPAALEYPDILLGNLYARRQSRKIELSGLGVEGRSPSPNDAHNPDRGSRVYGGELPSETQDWDAGGDVRRPDQAHLKNLAGNDSRVGGGGLERQERDLEGDVLLTRREKKEWAVVILGGSVCVCLMCGLIAGLAVS